MSISLVAIALSGCEYKAVITFWVINGLVSAGTSLSYTVSIIDFAPNYTGEFCAI